MPKRYSTAKPIQLGEVLEHIEGYSAKSHLFLPLDEVWTEQTRAAVLDWDESDAEKPPFATEHGLEPVLDIYSVLGIVENARLQVSQPSLQTLLEAFLFYYDNDAFIELDSLRSSQPDS